MDENALVKALLGLSGGLKNYGNSVKNRLSSLVDNPVGTLAETARKQIEPFAKSESWRRNGIDAMTGQSDTRRSIDEDMTNAAMGMVGPSSIGKIVYHGSPHKFDKFDMSKIGTGEGAQAYGRGLYMAESPTVAQEYAEKLAADRFINFPGGSPSTEAEKRVAEALLSRAKTTQTGHREAAISDAYRQFANPPKHMIGDPSTPKWAMPSEKEIARAIENMEAAKRLGVPSLSDSSQLYKADIPDEAINRMIDWDNGGAKLWNDAVSKTGSEEAARKALLSQGTPGIRYLDGGSRGTGAGTSNFVLFDDQMPRILERNGQQTGLQPWKPGEYK